MEATTKTIPTTCTVHVGVGEKCGAPAVTTWTATRSGETYGECADHATSVPAAAPAFTAGVAVRVSHAGIIKRGVIVDMRRTRASVEVTIGSGKHARPKVIERSIDDMEVWS